MGSCACRCRLTAFNPYPQAQAQAYHLDASPAERQLESSLAASKGLVKLAQNQQTDPLETLEHLKEFLNQIELEDQTKAASFKQAVMILVRPTQLQFQLSKIYTFLQINIFIKVPQAVLMFTNPKICDYTCTR